MRDMIEKEVDIIHQEHKKISQYCDIEKIVEQLTHSISNYLEFKQKN